MLDMISEFTVQFQTPIYLCLYFVVCAGILLFMGIDDWRLHDVSGELCFFAWLVIIAGCLLFNCRWGIVIFVVICVVLFYLPFEIAVFGDADIIPIAMYIVFFVRDNWGMGIDMVPALIPAIALFVVLYPYAVICCYSQGKRFKLFTGMMVPVLPAFVIAWWVSGPLVVAYISYMSGGVVFL